MKKVCFFAEENSRGRGQTFFADKSYAPRLPVKEEKR
jgi:hypothetical protein